LYELIATPAELKRGDFELRTIVAYLCVFFWALLSLAIWTITRSRFRRITARMPYRRPETPA
jgi:hypothetical protein